MTTGEPDRKPPIVPNSAIPGIAWPAMPAYPDALILALQYQYDQSQWWPAESLAAWQLRQAESLLFHAARTVPFYRERLARLPAVRRGQLEMATFRRLPILRRSDIQDAGDSLHSGALPKAHGDTSTIRTSGSTGRPITVLSTGLKSLHYQAANLRYHVWHGRDLTGTTAAIRIMVGADAETAESRRESRWTPAYPGGPMRSFNVMKPADEQIAWLVRENPDYLLTNPSNLRALIEHDPDAPRRIPKLTQVATMGEVLDDSIRALCRDRWKLPLADVYSAQEVGFIALQCPEHDTYHVHAEGILAEVLDERDRPCAPGRTGRLVITDLHNFAMPLIRYEIGDHAEVGEPCPCGRGLPVLNRVLGRTRNMLTLPSGVRVWPRLSSTVVATFEAIRQIQYVQRDARSLDLRLVVSRPLTAEEETRLTTTIADNLGHPFAIRIHYVDTIPRSASGKFEDFVSAISR